MDRHLKELPRRRFDRAATAHRACAIVTKVRCFVAFLRTFIVFLCDPRTRVERIYQTIRAVANPPANEHTDRHRHGLEEQRKPDTPSWNSTKRKREDTEFCSSREGLCTFRRNPRADNNNDNKAQTKPAGDDRGEEAPLLHDHDTRPAPGARPSAVSDLAIAVADALKSGMFSSTATSRRSRGSHNPV